MIGKNGGEDTLAHWPIASGMLSVDDASMEVLKYLDKIWDSLSSSGMSALYIAYIPIHDLQLQQKVPMKLYLMPLLGIKHVQKNLNATLMVKLLLLVLFAQK